MTNVSSHLLRAVNDGTTITRYGEAWLCTTPFPYRDGDSVSVLVEELHDGYRVSDRAEALDRLVMWGVGPDSQKASAAIKDARTAAQLHPIGSHPSETATFGSQDDIGRMVIDVALAAVRIEQLRWLAQDRPALTFDERLAQRLQSLAAAHRWTWDRRPEIKLRSGRARRITASVTGERGTAFIQAVSAADQDRAVEKCYYLFDRSSVERDHKMAALAGRRDDWPRDLAEDLAAVGVVTYFDEPHQIERELERITGTTPTVSAY